MRDFLVARVQSIRYAVAGIGHLVRSEPNARLHAMATGVTVAAGIVLRVSPGEWCWLIAAIGAVWVAEAMNTALELVADAVTRERHPLIGRAKDVAAGAVLLASIGAVGIGVCVFGERVMARVPAVVMGNGTSEAK